jgi:RNA polymerase primary sigma factor
LQALAEQSRIVRLPVNKVGFSNKVSKAWQQLEQEFERDPTNQEIADLLNVDTEDVFAVVSTHTRHISIDTYSGEDEDQTLIDVMENPNAERADAYLMYNESLRYEVQQSLHTLTERQKEVVCCYFGIGVAEALSLEDIGIKINLTRERVRQIKDRAIDKIKTSSRGKMLRVYLG